MKPVTDLKIYRSDAFSEDYHQNTYVNVFLFYFDIIHKRSGYFYAPILVIAKTI